jgi:hypothetical protein
MRKGNQWHFQGLSYDFVEIKDLELNRGYVDEEYVERH